MKVPMRVFLLSCLCAANAIVTNCNTDSLLQVRSLSIQPQEIVHPGQNITLRINYTSPIDIAGGVSSLTTRYNYIFTNKFKDSICNSVACPIRRGNHTKTFVYNIPDWLIGSTDTLIVWNDANNTQLLCLDIFLKIKSRMN